MWNGIWKLTAMVGVVGVGLFAAYQAQKGMNLSVASSPNDSASANSKSDRALSSTDEDPSAESLGQQPESLAVADLDLESIARDTKRKPKKPSDPSAASLSEFDSEPAGAKRAVTTAKTPGQIIPVKRTQRQPGVDFRENAEESFDSANESDAEPKALPEQPATPAAPKSAPAKKKKGDVVQQVSATLPEEPATLEEPAGDPFNDDLSAAADKLPAARKTAPKELLPEMELPAETEEPVKEAAPLEAAIEPVSEAPGRATLTNDAEIDSAPPRSKRAKLGAGKRIDLPTDLDSEPATAAPPAKSKSAAPAKTEEIPMPAFNDKTDDLSNFPAENDARPSSQQRAVERSKAEREEVQNVPLRDRSRSERNPEMKSRPASAPASLPDDLSINSSEEPAPSRSVPYRSRPAAPAQLPDDSSSPYLTDPPARSPETRARNTEYDKVTPVDMVGDGVAGDASQRGLQQPRLTIEKIAQQQAVIDQPLIYTIVVKNVGTVDAHNVVVEDRIPKGTELQGTSPQAELAGKRLIWNHLILKPNEEKRISIKVIPKTEGPVGSVARVYFATEVSAEIVVNAPQLEFTVKAPSEVRVGQHFDLVFNLRNTGKVDANNIIVRDLVPDQLKHEAGADIECPIGKMAPQEVREIVLPVTAMKTGSIMNRAVMTADSGVRKALDSPIDIMGEVLVLTRSGQNRLYVERAATFTNNIRNDGNQRADRVRIAEVVPAGMVFDTASDGGKYDANLKAVVWTVGPLAPGNDKTVSVKYVPKETGTHAAKITATGSMGSTASVQATVDVIGKPELQMETLSATGAVTVGDRITSKFQLNNTGTAAASNVQLRVRLPRELRLISVKGANFQQKDDYVQFEPIGELAPKTKMAYELVLEPIAEADAQIGLEISADHLSKPGRRVETIQIARDALK